MPETKPLHPPAKVIHLIDSGGIYGAERVILNLSREQIKGARFSPVVGCILEQADSHSDLYQAATQLELPALKVAIRNRHLPVDLIRAARLFKQQGIDLIHSHGYKPSVFGRIISLLSGIPITATCHSWYDTEHAPLKKRVMVAIEKSLYRRFYAVAGVSEEIRQELLAAGVDDKVISVIENGVEFDPLPPDTDRRNEIKDQFHLDRDSICLVNLARLTKQKAQHLIIEAVALLRQQGLNVSALILGEGERREELEALIAQRDLNDRISLPGFQDNIKEILSISDIFVLPSHKEGMPMSLLEAAAQRVPIIATSVGDIPNVVKHQHSGLLIPCNSAEKLAEAIATLISDPDKARSMADAAYQQAFNKYSSASTEASYRKFYQTTLSHYHG